MVFYKSVYEDAHLAIQDPTLEEGFPGKRSGIAGPSSTYQITLAARIRLTNVSTDSGIMSKGPRKLPSFNMYYEADKGFRASISTGASGKADFTYEYIASAGTYYYLILVYDGHKARFYVDGHLVEERDVTGSILTNYDNLYIKEAQDIAQLSGTVDKALIASEALSGAQIYDFIYGTSFADVVSRVTYDQSVFTFLPPGTPGVEAMWYGKDGTDYSFAYEGDVKISQGGLGYNLPSGSTWSYFLEKIVKPSMEHAAGVLGMTSVRIPMSWLVWGTILYLQQLLLCWPATNLIQETCLSINGQQDLLRTMARWIPRCSRYMTTSSDRTRPITWLVRRPVLLMRMQ